ncbi:gamma-glutamylcyclotransferase [Chamaesiphon sp. OTE_8_metabat_110]|uniref:gamma-glutamylcyclotransferase family protein n=1 Tax=Chamaesiphon sp. OTE_8_metabat_110 TaxID=2964696 RepID=UPI00286D6971|nr:gamma-glutamylcyclotransferase [Chamaesiphon sp. OTE_8_metabat_110]
MEESIATMNEDLHVFVYGTLKPGEANFDRYCGNRVITSRRAHIEGCLYDLPALGYPGAIHGNSQVHGFVISFERPTILAELDELEDFQPHRDPAKNDYNRESIVAYLSAVGATSALANRTASIVAWAYFMNPELVLRCGGIYLPDGWWVGDGR